MSQTGDSLPSCRICGAQTPEPIRPLANTTVYTCAQCHFVECHPMPRTESESAGDTAILTNEGFTRNLIRQHDALLPRYRSLAERRHEHFQKALGKSSYRLLEIGCGTAGMAEPFRSLGVNYHGIDIDGRLVAFANEHGHSVDPIDYFDYTPDQPFDVIMASQVIEHIVNPHAFVDKLAADLAPNGLILFDAPNHNSLSGIIHQRLIHPPDRHGAIQLPYHVMAYTKRSLARLFEGPFNAEVSTIPSTHRWKGQPNIYPFKQRIYHAVSGVVGLGSLLVVYGRKRSTSGHAKPGS